MNTREGITSLLHIWEGTLLATKKINTVNTMNTGDSAVSNAEYERSLKAAEQYFMTLPKETVVIPKQLERLFGNLYPVTVNGCTIHVPVDGKPYPLPSPFASVLYNAMNITQASDIREEVLENLKPADAE